MTFRTGPTRPLGAPMMVPPPDEVTANLLGRTPLWSSVEIISRLVRRFDLQDIASESDAMLMPRVIQPVTDVDELLRTTELGYLGAVDISAAVAFVSFFQVPIGKRWRLIGFVTSATTGSSTAAWRPDGGANAFNMNDGGTATSLRIFGSPLPLPERADIGRFSTNNGADTSESMTIWYTEEDAF